MAAPGLSPEVLNTPERSRGAGRAGPGKGQRATGDGAGGPVMIVAPRPSDVQSQARNNGLAHQDAGSAPDSENVHVRTAEVAPDLVAVDLAARILRAPDQRFPVNAPAFPVESLIVERNRAISAYQSALALTASGAPPLMLSAPDETEGRV